jgi:hypothetical protein
MGSHHSFEHLKHKLWPKEGPRVKLTVWFLTIKSWKSIWFPCVQVACDILLEKYQWVLQFYFRLHCIRGLHTKLWDPKVAGVPTWGISGLRGQNAIWMLASWRGTKYTIRGKVVASAKFGPWWILWVRGCMWFVLAPKMLKLCTNQLVV